MVQLSVTVFFFTPISGRSNLLLTGDEAVFGIVQSFRGPEVPRRATQNVRSLAPLPQMEGEPGNWGGGRGGKGGVFWEKMFFLGYLKKKMVLVGVM